MMQGLIGGNASGMEEAREVMRRAFHRVWYRRLSKEATKYYRAKSEAMAKTCLGRDDLIKDKEAIEDRLMRSRRSTWWEWIDDSRLYFWRWPECWREETRDGAKPFHVSWPPRRPVARKIQPETAWHQDKVDEKIGKLIERRYLRKPRKGQPIQVAIPYFPVQKGEDDVRVVWSNKENGVNGSIYVPRMWMPTGDTMTRKLPPRGWMGDIDSAEMFNNYMMHESESALNGVEISEGVRTKYGLDTRMLVWDRLLFGWRPAPLFAAHMFLRAIEMAKRSRYDIMSAFSWRYVRMNLPGSEKYNPALP
jgi:hypothetical protein